MVAINRSNYQPVARPLLPRLFFRRREEDTEERQSAALSVTFVDCAALMHDALGTAGYPLPLEGPWLYEVLEQSGLENQFTLFYALVFQRGVPVAAAPAFVMDVPMEQACPENLLKTLRAIARIVPSILYQRTLFVGYPSAAQGTIGIVPGTNRRAVLLALQRAFERKAHDLNAELMIWREMPADISADLEWVTKRRRLFRTLSLPSTIVKFSSQSKSGYFDRLTGSHRCALKRNLKRSAAAVDVVVEVLQYPAPALLEEILGLFRQTYLRAKMKFEELSPAWFVKIAGLPTTYFMVMREKQTGAMIAATAYFDRSPILVARHVGFDYTRPMSWLLYYRLWDALVDWALAKGFTSIYSGPTSYVAKIQTGHELIPLFNYLWHRNGIMHAIYRTVAQRLDWAGLDEDLAKFFKAHPEEEMAHRRPSQPAPGP